MKLESDDSSVAANALGRTFIHYEFKEKAGSVDLIPQQAAFLQGPRLALQLHQQLPHCVAAEQSVLHLDPDRHHAVLSA